MKYQIQIILLISLSINSYAQLSTSDSIQVSQNKTLKSICKEVSEISEELSKIDSTRFAKPFVGQQNNDSTIIQLDQKTINSIKEPKGFWDFIYRSIGNILGALITGAIALYIFFGGWKKEKIKEDEEKAEKVKEKNLYFKSVLNKAISLSDKYENTIDKFSSEIETDPYNIPEIELYPLQEFGRLQRIIENDDYFHAFLKKHGKSQSVIDKFRTIASISDYLESQTKEFLKVDYRLYDHNRKTQYSNLLTEVNEDVVELGMNYQATIPTLDQGLQQIITSYAMIRQGADPSDLHIPQNNLIQPLTQFLLNNQFFALEEVRSLLNKMSRMRQLYAEIPMQNQVTSNKFRLFQETMTKTISRLKSESESIIENADD